MKRPTAEAVANFPYLTQCREAAIARKRDIYVYWNGTTWESTIHAHMVPRDCGYYLCKPDGTAYPYAAREFR